MDQSKERTSHQIAGGLDAIVKSGLAKWDQADKKLIATDETTFECYCACVHPRSGRWLCWIAFGIGAESFVTGAFGMVGHTMGKFGGCHPWKKQFGMTLEDVGRVSTAICDLAKIRNRDAHFYVKNVRQKDFPGVTDFVEAINTIIRYTGPDKVAGYYASNSESSQT